MDEQEKTGGGRKNAWLPIAGGVALIITLFILVKLIFAGLERALPPERLHPDYFTASASQGQAPGGPEDGAPPAPAFCPFCGEGMTDSFQWGQFCPWCGEKVEA